jgi:MoaA/NifB/PqqE/SkfB family radical SAM enzyme
MYRFSSIYFEITDDCNLRCLHCYNESDKEKNIIQFSKTNREKIFKIAKKIVELGVSEVVLTGGEPLTKKDLVLELLEFFSKNNIHVCIKTNLILLTEDFLKDPRSRLASFLVSCYSSNPNIYGEMTCDGNYDIFEENLKLLQKYKIKFGVNMNVNTRNLQDVRNTAIHMNELGVKNFYVTPMSLNFYNPDSENFLTEKQMVSIIYNIIWIKDELTMKVDILGSIPKYLFLKENFDKDSNFLSRKCEAGLTIAIVNYEGDIRPCPNSEGVYGNILEDNFLLIYKKMNNWRRKRNFLIQCKECDLEKKGAFGSCKITSKSFDEHYKINKKDPWSQESFKEKIPLSFSNIVSLSDKLQYIPEYDGRYNTSIDNVNKTFINKEVYTILSYIKRKEKVSLINLAGTKKIFYSEKFQYIIKILIAKKYLKVII